MAVEIVGDGKNNVVDLHPWFQKFGRLKIVLTGNNNFVSIPDQPRSCNGMLVQFGSDCSLRVGEGCSVTNTFVAGVQGAEVLIGAMTTFTARARFISHEASRIELGADCMIASDVQFMTSDVHTILDSKSKKRINPSSNIEIGDHVWISLQTFVMKGARIGTNSVIGLRSVVTGSIPPECLAVGAPARVIRRGVNWDRKLWPMEDEAVPGLEPVHS